MENSKKKYTNYQIWIVLYIYTFTTSTLVPRYLLSICRNSIKKQTQKDVMKGYKFQQLNFLKQIGLLVE